MQKKNIHATCSALRWCSNKDSFPMKETGTPQQRPIREFENFVMFYEGTTTRPDDKTRRTGQSRTGRKGNTRPHRTQKRQTAAMPAKRTEPSVPPPRRNIYLQVFLRFQWCSKLPG